MEMESNLCSTLWCVVLQGKKTARKRKPRNRGWKHTAASQKRSKNRTQNNTNTKGKSNCGKHSTSTASYGRKQPGILGLPQCRSFLASSVGQYMG